MVNGDSPLDHYVISCHGRCNTNRDAMLDKYYCDKKMCLHMAATSCVPSVKMGI